MNIPWPVTFTNKKNDISFNIFINMDLFEKKNKCKCFILTIGIFKSLEYQAKCVQCSTIKRVRISNIFKIEELIILPCPQNIYNKSISGSKF